MTGRPGAKMPSASAIAAARASSRATWMTGAAGLRDLVGDELRVPALGRAANGDGARGDFRHVRHARAGSVRRGRGARRAAVICGQHAPAERPAGASTARRRARAVDSARRRITVYSQVMDVNDAERPVRAVLAAGRELGHHAAAALASLPDRHPDRAAFWLAHVLNRQAVAAHARLDAEAWRARARRGCGCFLIIYHRLRPLIFVVLAWIAVAVLQAVTWPSRSYLVELGASPRHCLGLRRDRDAADPQPVRPPAGLVGRLGLRDAATCSAGSARPRACSTPPPSSSARSGCRCCCC